MCKLKLSYNTWKPALGDYLSTLHTNYACPAIQGNCPGWHLCTTHKLHLSCNTGNLSWVAPLYYTQTAPIMQYREPSWVAPQYYTQTTPVVQYRKPVMGGTSVLHTNYACRAIQETCHGWHLSTKHKLRLSCNTGNLSWVAPQYYTQATPVVQHRELAIDGHLSIMDKLQYLPYINGTSPGRPPLVLRPDCICHII